MALHATIVPDSLILSGSWTIGGGAPSLVSAVADASDLTYAADVGPSGLWFSLSDIPPLPAEAEITHLRVRFRASMPVYVAGNVNMYLIRSGGSGPIAMALGPLSSTISEADITLTEPPGGGSWTEAIVNGLWLASASWHAGETRLHRAWIEVYTNSPPSAIWLATDPSVVTTVSGPGDPVRNWSYFDADSDPQVQVQIKLFADGAAVADPETEVARLLSDTGPVNYTGTVIGINAWPNGSYMLAIKASDGTGFGPWSQRGLTFDLPVPPPPLLTATPEPGLARYAVTLDEQVGTYPTEFFQIERSETSGMTYVGFYGGGNVAFSGSPVTVWDYRSPRMARPYTAASITPIGYNEALSYNAGVGYNGTITAGSVGPLNVVRYRARAGRIYNGVTIWSGWTTITPDNLVGDGTTWLKHPTDPGKSVLLQQVANWETTSEEDMSILRAAHGRAWVVFAGVASWKRGELELIFSSDAAFYAFEALRAPLSTVVATDLIAGGSSPATPTSYLFQSCFGDTVLEQVWMRLGPTLSVTRVTTGPQQHTNQYRRVKIGFVETSVPSS